MGGGLFKMVVMTSHSRFEPYISKAKEDRKKDGKRTQLTNNDGRGVEEREREREEKREERRERERILILVFRFPSKYNPKKEFFAT